MPRKAKLFLASSGSAARGFLKFRANIPPRWIKNAQKSRKRIEPKIVEALHSHDKHEEKSPPGAGRSKESQPRIQSSVEPPGKLITKENFYRGIRIPCGASAQRFIKAVTLQPLISNAC